MDGVSRQLSRLRTEAESRMTVTVRIESVATAPDPLTGADVVTPTTVHAALPCRIKAGALQGIAPDVQGAALTTSRDELHFPWATLNLRPGLRAVVTAVGPLDPPYLLGNLYRLASPSEGSQQTAQRWAVESWPTTS